MYSCTIKSLAAFSEISDISASLARAEIRRRVLSKLSVLLSDGEGLLNALDACNSVLSGKWVLAIVDPLGQEKANHLEILAGDDRFSLFVHWLEANEGAQLIHHLSYLPDFTPGSYHYALTFRCPHVTIRVVRSVRDNPHHLVAHYVATHLMNYITSSHLVVAYPSLTFKRKGLLVGDLLPRSLSGGFTLVESTGETRGVSCKVSQGCGACTRWFNDTYSTVLALQEQFEVAGNVHWRLGGLPCNAACSSTVRLVGDDRNI